MNNFDAVPAWLTELRSPLDDAMGLELLAASPEKTVGCYPVAGNTQVAGLWHGGASCVAAETLGSIAALTHARPLGKVAVGIDINATHHAAVRAGFVTGVATPLHLGSTVATYEVVLTDDDHTRVCTARITCLLIERPAGKTAP